MNGIDGQHSPEAERVETLYEAANALPETQRSAFLDAQCGRDTALRRELDSLLGFTVAAEGFFSGMRGAVDAIIDDLVPATHDEYIGTHIGQYRVDARLGVGGMGVVYRAYDTRLRRTVALKLLAAHLCADDRARERFLIEARAAAALDHPNICTIHDTGETPRGVPFLAMAFCDGETLKTRIERGPLALETALRYATQIARGLSAAHAHGIVHRDVKPGNVMVTTQDVPRLVDFGLARLPDVTLTLPGLTPGTVAYMAPEQLRAGDIDGRTDLWSLGVVLFEMLTGARPFAGDSNESVAYAVTHEEPTSLESLRPDLPREVHAIAGRLLQKDPAHRYASADALLADLGRVGTPEAGLVVAAPAPPRHVDPRHAGRVDGVALPWHRRLPVFLLAALGLGAVALLYRPWEAAPPATRSAPRDLVLGIQPVLLATARSDLAWLADAVDARLSSELTPVFGLEVRTSSVIGPWLDRSVPLDSVAVAANVDFFVRTTLTIGHPDSLVATLELNEAGVRPVRAGTLRLSLGDANVAETAGRRAAELLRQQLGSHIRERQHEASTSNAPAEQHRRRADQFRVSANALVRADPLAAGRLLDSAVAQLALSERLDPDWLVPRLMRARLSEVRAGIVLAQSGGSDAAGVRAVFDAGIAAVNEVLADSPEDPVALALRGRLRWQRLTFGDRDMAQAGTAVNSALQDLRAAVAIDSTLPRAVIDLSQALYETGQFAEAGALAAQAFRMDAFLDESSAIINRLAASAFESGEDQEAMEWCRAGLRRFPDNPAHSGCLLEVMAWGSGPFVPDSAWAVYHRFAQQTAQSNMGSRAHYLLHVAGVLAQTPNLPADSVKAVLRRQHQLVADSSQAPLEQHRDLLGWEAAVWFRMGDPFTAHALYDEMARHSAALARTLGGRRVLRGYTAPDSLPTPSSTRRN